LDNAADVIDFGKKVEIKNTNFKNGETEKNIIKNKFYSIDKIKILNSYEDSCSESMIIYTVLDGNGKIFWNENEFLELKKGENILIPVNLKVQLEGNFEILRTTIEE